jgi:serine/threonine protein phosphatase PrpC
VQGPPTLIWQLVAAVLLVLAVLTCILAVAVESAEPSPAVPAKRSTEQDTAARSAAVKAVAEVSGQEAVLTVLRQEVGRIRKASWEDVDSVDQALNGLRAVEETITKVPLDAEVKEDLDDAWKPVRDALPPAGRHKPTALDGSEEQLKELTGTFVKELTKLIDDRKQKRKRLTDQASQAPKEPALTPAGGNPLGPLLTVTLLLEGFCLSGVTMVLSREVGRRTGIRQMRERERAERARQAGVAQRGGGGRGVDTADRAGQVAVGTLRAVGTGGLEPSGGSQAPSSVEPCGSGEPSGGSGGRAAGPVVVQGCPRRQIRPVLVRASSGHSAVTTEITTRKGLALVAGSMVGLEHSREGGLREDAFAMAAARKDGFAVVAVADGVGTARHSHLAAMAAVDRAIDYLAETPVQVLHPLLSDPDLRATWASGAAQYVAGGMAAGTIEQRAASLGHLGLAPRTQPPAATLACAAVFDGPGRRGVLWFVIGDAAMGLIRPGAPGPEWRRPQFASAGSRTDSLPGNVAQVVTEALELGDGEGLLLATDGMCEVLRLSGEEGNRRLRALTADPMNVELVAPVLSLAAPGSYDDRTFVLVSPLPPV